MSTPLPNSLKQLVQAFCRLPGVGEKTALRYTLHLIASHHAPMQALSEALGNAAARLQPCDACGNIAERTTSSSAALSENESGHVKCSICLDPTRDGSQLCVVARIPDLLALERSGALRGRYFVLGQLLSPLDGVGPEQLPLSRLASQIEKQGVKELVLATPPSVEGEATALHLAREFGDSIRVTRIASGVPHGGDLEFADPITLGRALAGRRSLEND